MPAPSCPAASSATCPLAHRATPPLTPTAPPTAVSSELGRWPGGSAQICSCGVGRVKDGWNPSEDRDPGLQEDRGSGHSAGAQNTSGDLLQFGEVIIVNQSALRA